MYFFPDQRNMWNLYLYRFLKRKYLLYVACVLPINNTIIIFYYHTLELHQERNLKNAKKRLKSILYTLSKGPKHACIKCEVTIPFSKIC